MNSRTANSNNTSNSASNNQENNQENNQVINYDYFDKFIQELLSLFRSNRERLFSSPDGRGKFHHKAIVPSS